MSTDPSASGRSFDAITWDRPDRVETLSIETVARRAGHYCWLNQRLFETLGGWVQATPEAGVAQRLLVHSSRFRWHQELWTERLPTVAEFEPTELIAPPNDAVRRAMSVVADAGSTTERLVGAYRVLVPRLLGAYRYQAAHTSSMTDAPTARVLDLAMRDVATVWSDGEMMIQALLDSGDDARLAAQQHERVEVLMIQAGGVCGPGSIG